MSKSGGKTDFDFEKGMTRLEEIIRRFDEGELTLDEMEAHFTEGMELLKQCGERLDQVETRVTKLLTAFKEQWSTAPFDETEEN